MEFESFPFVITPLEVVQLNFNPEKSSRPDMQGRTYHHVPEDNVIRTFHADGGTCWTTRPILRHIRSGLQN